MGVEKSVAVLSRSACRRAACWPGCSVFLPSFSLAHDFESLSASPRHLPRVEFRLFCLRSTVHISFFDREQTKKESRLKGVARSAKEGEEPT